MSGLKIEQIHKKFGTTHVLKGIDIEIEQGDFLILVGPSGCGKSTLLHMIAGLESVTSGTISIGDRDVTHLSPKDRDIAMVFQSYALYPNMTVRENISFGLSIRKVPQQEQQKTVQRVAEMLQIEPLLERKPAQLSGGQRQRVAMGRALAREPSIFLFDEPLSNLDAKLRVEMRTEIKELHHRLGTTMVYVTHDQIEAMTLGERIAIMKDGIIQQFGSPREIYDNPVNQFVAGFIGSPSMNFIPCSVISMDNGHGVEMENEAAKFVLPLGRSEPALESRVGKTVLLGIRPEKITHHRASDVGSPGIHQASCRVEIVEPTGPDTLVFVKLNGVSTVCRVDPDQAKKVGENIDLMFDMNRAVFFEAEKGTRIC